MVTNTPAAMEVVDTGEKRDRVGRKITPAARREELVGAWRCQRQLRALARWRRVARLLGPRAPRLS